MTRIVCSGLLVLLLDWWLMLVQSFIGVEFILRVGGTHLGETSKGLVNQDGDMDGDMGNGVMYSMDRVYYVYCMI